MLYTLQDIISLLKYRLLNICMCVSLNKSDKGLLCFLFLMRVKTVQKFVGSQVLLENLLHIVNDLNCTVVINGA